MTENEKPPTESPTPTPVEELLGSEVIADAERRAERIRRRGERDAEQIHQSAEKEATEAAEAVLEDARRRAEQASEMVLATLGVEAQKVTLALKEGIVQRAVDAAWQSLLAKERYDYRGTLIQLASSAIGQMPGGEFTLQLGEEDRERVGEEVCRRIEEAVAAHGGRAVKVRLSPTYLRIAGGCVVTGENGRLRYDNSFEARERRMHEEVRRLAAQGLFGADEQHGTRPDAND
jgi:vacuolar-type H+-ATPase subunit E/Vma4